MPEPELTTRQAEILRLVVDEYIATGQPVASRSVVEQGGLPYSASTVRAELAELETRGLLTHPHTSAGRVPTERGYRRYAERLLERLDPRPDAFPLALTAARSEVEAALRSTTEMLAQATRLLALVSAPPVESTTVRHVEVLLLQPGVVMVVVITSTGGVSKRLFSFDDAVDPGLAAWAREYLNEQVAGLGVGTHMLRQRFEDPGLSGHERAFLAVLRPAFTELVEDADQRFFVGGQARLLADARGGEVEGVQRLLELLERRAAVLELMGTHESRRPYVRVGVDLVDPALRDVSLVAAPYGLANRSLGAVGLLGPVRMDYEKAIRSVRAAAFELSRFVEDVYETN
jgi:heat-inducible transcriptional repressor